MPTVTHHTIERREKTFDEVMDAFSTGDVLLYRTKDLGATFNSCMQRSFWSHVGVVVRGDPATLAPLFPDDYQDVDDANRGLCIFEAVPRRGVSIFPLKDRLARTLNVTRALAVRRRVGPALSTEQQASLLSFVCEVRGRKLEFASTDMVRALCCFNKREDWNEFFCSELVAEALQQMGVLQEEKLNSNDVLPRRCARSLPPSYLPPMPHQLYLPPSPAISHLGFKRRCCRAALRAGSLC